MRSWCGYLSEARCRLFAYGPADATAILKHHHLLPHLNPDWFSFLVPVTQAVLEKRPLNRCSSSVVVFLISYHLELWLWPWSGVKIMTVSRWTSKPNRSKVISFESCRPMSQTNTLSLWRTHTHTHTHNSLVWLLNMNHKVAGNTYSIFNDEYKSVISRIRTQE